jgi:hypothetical protein
MKPLASRHALYGLAALWGVAIVVCFAALPPIAQWESYHQFADRRRLLGVPNAANVLSNAAFLIVGVVGLASLRGRRGPGAPHPPPFEPGARGLFAVLYAAVMLVAFGSAYYHLAPSTPRLFWDRLPITLVVMAIVALVIDDRIGSVAGRRALWPLLTAGAASTLAWRATGDLRAYGIVVFVAMLAIVLLLLLRPGRHDRGGYLAALAVLYGAARLFEVLDRSVFAATGHLASGHTLKHLSAAAGVAMLIPYLGRRRLVGPAES